MTFTDRGIGQVKLNEFGSERSGVVQDLLKADFWANGHFPQIWSVKAILIAESFLKNYLEHKINFEELEALKDPKFDKTVFLRRANNAHKLYNVKKIEPELYDSTFARSISEAVEVIRSLVPISDFGIVNQKKIKSLFSIFECMSIYLKGPDSLMLSKRYRESLSGVSQNYDNIETRLTTDEETKLEGYWTVFSETLVSGILESAKSQNERNLYKINKNNIDSFEKYLKNASKVVFIQNLSKYAIIPS